MRYNTVKTISSSYSSSKTIMEHINVSCGLIKHYFLGNNIEANNSNN